jgi:quercetin dioxygenase-like cupin family protein
MGSSSTLSDYEPGGFSRAHRHPAGACVYVIDGSVGIDDREPVVLKAGDSFYEPPGALHAVSRDASEELPASMLAFFVLGEAESPTVYDGADGYGRVLAATRRPDWKAA